MGNSVPTSNSELYKRYPNEERLLKELNRREEFYMNAPRQMDINKIRERVDLPPIAVQPEEVSMIAKNAPIKSNKSKLMQQLQQKKMLTKPKSGKNAAKAPSSKASFIMKSKKGKVPKKENYASDRSICSGVSQSSKESPQGYNH